MTTNLRAYYIRQLRASGWRGNHGGWVTREDGKGLVQGWDPVIAQLGRSMDRLGYGLAARPALVRALDTPELDTPELDALTRRLTAFRTFRELLDTHPSYRPSIITDDLPHRRLAQAYDVAMAARGDARRAWRGSRVAS